MPKKISIMIACYNEEENVKDMYLKIKEIFSKLPQYSYEHIFIDNASTDRTVPILKELAASDPKLKIIVNTRNFGHIRSPFHGLLQTSGDAVILLAADFQDPPDLIPEFIRKWEEGYSVIAAVKTNSKENPLMFAVRNLYYNLVKKLADVEQTKNFFGFGMYDRKVIDELRKIEDPYPYFRGLINEMGYDKAIVEYVQPRRAKGKTKNNFYTLYDMAMLGFISYSKLPLRMASFLGFGMSLISFAIAMVYLILKLVYWHEFQLGLAPLVIGIFFFSSIQLFFIGILGEYIGAIYTQVKKRPMVVERERINF